METNNLFNEKGFLGLRKGTWLVDILSIFACAIIVWELHVKPIADSMTALGVAHEMAFNIMADSHIYFATSDGVHTEDLMVPFHCIYICDEEMVRIFNRALLTAGIHIPDNVYPDSSRGRLLQKAHYVLMGELNPSLVDLSDAKKKSQQLLNDRLNERKGKLFKF